VRILGIDPGSRATGYGIVEVEGANLVRVCGGIVRVGGLSLPERLARICQEIEDVIHRGCPEMAAIESVFTARNARSALLLGQARGAALTACGRCGLATAEYAPREVKRAVVGYGAADKAQVQQMVQRILGLASPRPRDEADALATAICHAHSGPPKARSRARVQTASEPPTEVS